MRYACGPWHEGQDRNPDGQEGARGRDGVSAGKTAAPAWSYLLACTPAVSSTIVLLTPDVLATWVLPTAHSWLKQQAYCIQQDTFHLTRYKERAQRLPAFRVCLQLMRRSTIRWTAPFATREVNVTYKTKQ